MSVILVTDYDCQLRHPNLIISPFNSKFSRPAPAKQFGHVISFLFQAVTSCHFVNSLLINSPSDLNILTWESECRYSDNFYHLKQKLCTTRVNYCVIVLSVDAAITQYNLYKKSHPPTNH